jgi:hypothetical protein
LLLQLGRVALRNVAADLGGPDHSSFIVMQRRNGQRHRDQPAILSSAVRFEMLDPLSPPDSLEN